MGKDHNRLGPYYFAEKKDYISELPETVLNHLLTFLPIDDLVSVSKISKKFNQLPKSAPYISFTSLSVLQQDLHALSFSDKLYQPGFLKKNAENFVQKANGLVKLHHGKNLEFFKVYFPLNSEHGSSIDKWVKFAIDGNAREIVLNFSTYLPALSGKIYKFPYWHFTGTKTSEVLPLKQLTLARCSFKVLENSYGLSSLQSLYLKDVRLSNDDVANLLSCCTSLSWLRFNSCTGLKELEISHTSAKLRYLRVDCDENLNVITISDSSLQIFEYYPYNEPFSDVKFERVPRLSTVSVLFPEAGPCTTLGDILTGPVSTLRGSLQTLFLSLEAPFKLLWDPLYYDPFSHMKKLIMSIKTSPSVSFLGVAPFLKAMPYVEEIHFEIDTVGEAKTKKLQKISADDFVLVFLRLIRIGGFKTDPGHIELAMYLVKNAPNLESLVIDTRKHVYDGDNQWKRVYAGKYQMLQEARRTKLTHILSDKMPPTVELKVL